MNESVLQRLVLARLLALGLFVWRQNTGKAQMRGRWVQFGLPGQADLTGVLPNGRRLEVELKSDSGRLSLDQRAFRDRITASGGLYIAARTLDEVLAPVLEAIR